MAEWLRPADCEILTIRLRGSTTSTHILSPKKVHIARRVGFNHVQFYMAGSKADILGQDGRVVMASRLCEVLMLSCGIEYQVAHLVSEKKVNMARRVGFNHVCDSIWLA